MAGRASKRTDKEPFFPNLYMAIYKQFGSIRKFCDETGLGRRGVYQVLYGSNFPSYEFVKSACQATGQTFEWLFKEAHDV